MKDFESSGRGLVAAGAVMFRLGVSEEELLDYCERNYLTPRLLCSEVPLDAGMHNSALKGLARLPGGGGGWVFNDVGFDPQEIELLEAAIAKHKQAQPVSTTDAPDGEVPDSAWEEWTNAIAVAKIGLAARTRLNVWLKRKRGEKVATLEAEYPGRNIERDVRDAKKKDVPALKQMFPALPDLGG